MTVGALAIFVALPLVVLAGVPPTEEDCQERLTSIRAAIENRDLDRALKLSELLVREPGVLYPQACTADEPYAGPAELDVISDGDLQELILLPGRPPLPIRRLSVIVSTPEAPEVQARGCRTDVCALLACFSRRLPVCCACRCAASCSMASLTWSPTVH